MGKAIYQPKGKAKEYNQWAVNFYNGCTGNCTYCYNKKGRSAKLLGKIEPTLKRSLINEETAIKIFKKEAIQNLTQLRKNGLLFNFVSDPLLPETELLNTTAMRWCMIYDIPMIILTKQANWIVPFLAEIKNNGTIWNSEPKKHLFSFGFTLTGHDELEPGCSTNTERIQAMKQLHELGFTTWASIEPIIDFKSSLEMIDRTTPFCNHYKIGLESGKKYDQGDLENFVEDVNTLISYDNNRRGRKITVYWKDSVANQLDIGSKHLVFLTSEPFVVKAEYKFWWK